MTRQIELVFVGISMIHSGLSCCKAYKHPSSRHGKKPLKYHRSLFRSDPAYGRLLPSSEPRASRMTSLDL